MYTIQSLITRFSVTFKTRINLKGLHFIMKNYFNLILSVQENEYHIKKVERSHLDAYIASVLRQSFSANHPNTRSMD